MQLNRNKLLIFALSGIENDEVLAGFFARHRNAGPITLSNQVWAGLNHTGAGGTAWLLPSNLHQISELFNEKIGDAASLLQNNTVFPAICRFIAPEHACKLLSHFLHSSVPGISGIAGLGGMNRRHESVKKGYCCSCVRESNSLDGRPIWRRDFIMPGLRFCGKHEEPIQVLCAFCHDGYFRKNAQSYVSPVCNCRRKSDVPLYNLNLTIELHIKIANVFTKLLNDGNQHRINYEKILYVATERGEKMGLARNGLVNSGRTAEFMNDNNLINFISMRQLNDLVTGRKLPPNSISAIAALTSIFSTWDSLEGCVNDLDFPQTLRKKPEAHYRQLTNVDLLCPARRVSVKNRYFELKLQFPELAHQKLTQRLPSGDRKYASLMVLGIEKGVKGMSEEWRVQYYLELDESLEVHIRAQGSLLISANIRTRISRNLLLKGHRMTSIWSQISSRLPRSKIALAAFEESNQQKQLRHASFGAAMV